MAKTEEIQIEETKIALESLLTEFGFTLPSRFLDRMINIGRSFVHISTVNGIWYEGRSYIFDSIETIIYHSGHGSSIEELRDEMRWLIDHLHMLNNLSMRNRGVDLT